VRRLLIVLVVAAASMVWAPTAASAKGPVDAVLRGPDVAGEGVAKLDQFTAMDLAQATSLYSVLDGGHVTGSRLVDGAPSGRLGPKYRVTFRFAAGEGDDARVRQTLYPFAAHGPIAYTPPGQKLCDRCPRSSGGWSDVRYVALDVLAAYRVSVPSSMHASDWPTTRDDAHGLSISYPPSWHAAPSTLTPVLADPITPLAVGTAAMVPQQLGECDIVPQRAVEAVGPTDALVVVYLYQGMASWSAKLERPLAFGPELPWSTGLIQCTDGNPKATVSTLAFTDGPKHITVMTVVGNDASPQRHAEVYAVLDSLRVA
jgi:hypothetical protein